MANTTPVLSSLRRIINWGLVIMSAIFLTATLLGPAYLTKDDDRGGVKTTGTIVAVEVGQDRSGCPIRLSGIRSRFNHQSSLHYSREKYDITVQYFNGITTTQFTDTILGPCGGFVQSFAENKYNKRLVVNSPIKVLYPAGEDVGPIFYDIETRSLKPLAIDPYPYIFLFYPVTYLYLGGLIGIVGAIYTSIKNYDNI